MTVLTIPAPKPCTKSRQKVESREFETTQSLCDAVLTRHSNTLMGALAFTFIGTYVMDPRVLGYPWMLTVYHDV